MNDRIRSESLRSHRLLQLGSLLFLLGLLIGFLVPFLANPRMGLSSHLEGVMNGILLIVLGLMWHRLDLAPGASASLFWLAIYGTFANLTATLLAAVWGAGASMPIAASGNEGLPAQESMIDLLLASLSIAMVGAGVLMLWGLKSSARGDAGQAGA